MFNIFSKKITLHAVHISGKVISFTYETNTDLKTAREEFSENFKQYSAADPESRDQIMLFGPHIIRASDFSAFHVE